MNFLLGIDEQIIYKIRVLKIFCKFSTTLQENKG